MNKNLFKYIAFFAISLFIVGCNDSESDLLKTRVFFEDNVLRIDIDGQSSEKFDIMARLSKPNSSDIDITYTIADGSVVEEYSKRIGKEYLAYSSENVELSTAKIVISKGNIYADKSQLTVANLDELEEGQDYLIPIRINSPSIPVMDDTDILYVVINNPKQIRKVGRFNSNSVKIPLAPGRIFQSVTYEALVYIDRFGSNNTVMGCEGVLILRIGDQALPEGANNLLQIAGNKQFYSSQKLVNGKWYHLAFVYNSGTNQAALYINGEEAATATWDGASFDLSSDGGGFFVGKVDGFMWGERPLNGALSEVRLWSIARSQTQIKQNMLDVDPNTNGLAAYYKFDGTDQYQDENGVWYVKDSSGSGMNGLPNRGNYALTIRDLVDPIKIE